MIRVEVLRADRALPHTGAPPDGNLSFGRILDERAASFSERGLARPNTAVNAPARANLRSTAPSAATAEPPTALRIAAGAQAGVADRTVSTNVPLPGRSDSPFHRTEGPIEAPTQTLRTTSRLAPGEQPVWALRTGVNKSIRELVPANADKASTPSKAARRPVLLSDRGQVTAVSVDSEEVIDEAHFEHAARDLAHEFAVTLGPITYRCRKLRFTPDQRTL